MEDALKRLDKLTQEEVRMAVAENLKATHAVNERVRGVANTMVAMDNRVASMDDRVSGVDARVARVDDRVAGVDDKVDSIDDKVVEVINGTQSIFIQTRQIFNLSYSDGKETKQVMDQVKRSSSLNLICTGYVSLHTVPENQLRENIHQWLSPPDPSTNHNIACDTHNKKTASWFFQGSIFREWKSTGSLLWIHGKRAPCFTSYPMPFDNIVNYSWLWQEYSLVSGRLALFS